MDRALPQAYDSSDPIDPTAETVINAVPYVLGEIPTGSQELDDRPDAPVSAIKGRIVTAASQYLDAQRDTVGG